MLLGPEGGGAHPLHPARSATSCYGNQARSQGGGGGSGGSYDPPPQLPIPKILFHPLAILFHPLAILLHLSAILFHPLAILFHPSAILFHPLAILFHPSAILFHPLAILFHPWNMWMTSHGQCPRGGACECPRVGAFFKLMTSRGQCPRGGGCAWCSTHPSSDPPPHLAGWLRAWELSLPPPRRALLPTYGYAQGRIRPWGARGTSGSVGPPYTEIKIYGKSPYLHTSSQFSACYWN